MQFPRAAKAEGDAKFSSDVNAAKPAQGRCPYGFDRLQEGGAQAAQQVARARPEGDAQPAQGRCPYGFDRLQEGGAQAAQQVARAQAEGDAKFSSDVSAAKPAQGRCPYGFDRLQEGGAQAAQQVARAQAEGDAKFSSDVSAAKPAEGRCPYGFDRLQEGTGGQPKSSATAAQDASAAKPAEGRCPYGFDRLQEGTGGQPRSSATAAQAPEGRCPYGFDRLQEGEQSGKQKNDVNVAKASDIGRSKVADLGSPAEFVDFLGKALKDRSGAEMKEFYVYLQDCFTNADHDLDGLIGPKEFDGLVEEAAIAPRKFGFAPTADQMYMSEAERLERRTEMFRVIDTKGRGMIAFPEFLTWALEHIQSKVSRGAKPWKSGVGMLSLIQPQSPEDFTQFLKAATSSKSSPEYKDLYFHLLRCFTDADTTMTGVIDADGFDNLIDIAAMAPRKFGFAPSTAVMFKSEAERKASRAALFKTIDKDGSGNISFDEFLEWAFEHIKGKVQGGVRAAYPPTEVKEDASLEAKNLPIYDEASSPADFAAFCKTAVTDKASAEYQKLYYHLLRCFTSADSTHSGRISAGDFDGLIDVAAAAPRKFGFAPHASEMYVSVDERKVARANLFKAIDEDGSGEISFQEFLAWAVDHIRSKVMFGATPYKAGVGKLSLIQTSSPEDFTQFLKAATASKGSPEYKDLYFHLLRCFTDADTTMSGVIDADGFDKLIDIAAMAPRKYGFAPSTAQMFKDEQQRKASRAALFKTIDKDGGGTISFDEFLEWAFEHIKEKVKGGVRAAYEPTPVKVDSSLEAKNLPIYDEASSPADFAAFCKTACTDPNSTEYQQLYYHLLRCFSDADSTLTGRITAQEFDGLIDIAAAAPRKFGFAPAASEMFRSVEERKVSRAALFQTIDADGSGEISFQEFLTWAVEHIKSKAMRGATPYKAGVGKLALIQTSSPEDFTRFLKAATASRSSPEFKDLYFHLLRCFTDADTTMTGVINADGFDNLIDIAAMAPRKYGFAPSTASMFKSEADRKASRAAMFKTIDKDGSGNISFDEFLEWAFDHIKGKVQGGVRAAYTPTAVKADTSLEAKNLPIYDDASSPKDFVAFCKAAVADRTSLEYQKLYYHLLRCFSDADAGLKGRITAADFDGLIDIAAAAPRKFGFAPTAAEMFATPEERKKAREALFRKIDADGSGEISFQEFLEWAVEHIEGKVAGGVQSWVVAKHREARAPQGKSRGGAWGKCLGGICGKMCQPASQPRSPGKGR